MAGSKLRSGTVVGDLAALLESGYDSDVTLVAGEARIEAHRLILSARSPVFAAILRRHQREASLEIPDTEKDVLRQLLTFIYTDEAPELVRMAPQLLVAADKYDLQVLKDRCEQQLIADLDVENAADSAVLAVERCCPELRRAVVGFIRSHSLSVMGTRGWNDALHSHPKALSQVSRLVSAPAQTESRTALQRVGSSQETYRAPRGPEDLASRRMPGLVRSKSHLGGFAPMDEPQSPNDLGSREKPESSTADSGLTDWLAMRMAKATGSKSGPLSPHSQTSAQESQSSGKSSSAEDRPETRNKPDVDNYPWWYVPSQRQEYNTEASAFVNPSHISRKSLTKSEESVPSKKSPSTGDKTTNDDLPWWY
ncbi:BTB/POZ and MATH domain-containing protein 6-like [Schistocerca americana]|uniref:BTB/POZ and MATH domain-containing protein 6-like n=1 Tax=Schistocerca americana TaxID=7009 RepID=UPI001F501FC6|nr:BTB/POZ and MATH domain-containing protein 6-like [Schistocerca americana]